MYVVTTSDLIRLYPCCLTVPKAITEFLHTLGVVFAARNITFNSQNTGQIVSKLSSRFVLYGSCTVLYRAVQSNCAIAIT